jgi:tRNA A37 threonylcarbamoyladenosine biosynthesis protein TsaE
VIEWGDVVAPVLAPDFLEVRLEYADAADERRLRLRVTGNRWAARKTALRAAVDRWSIP